MNNCNQFDSKNRTYTRIHKFSHSNRSEVFQEEVSLEIETRTHTHTHTQRERAFTLLVVWGYMHIITHIYISILLA